MEKLRSYLDRYIHLSDEQFLLLSSCIKVVELSQGDYFLREGNICRTIGFVIEGTLRTLHFDREGEVTAYFIQEGSLVVLPDSFRYQAPANENIQAVTPVRLWVIRYEDMISLFGEIASLGRLMLTMVEEVTHKRRLTRLMVGMDTAERVQVFKREYPGLMESLPVLMLASFLKVSPNELKKMIEGVNGSLDSILA